METGKTANTLSPEFGEALIQEARRRLFDESWPRVVKCLSLLSAGEIWHRPNNNTASIGNLVLHLCGNARQWIVSGLGGTSDDRNRAAEFEEQGPIPRDELLGLLETTMKDVAQTLDALDPATLLEKRPVQCFEESGVSILVHVIEHFSYHTGQITYAVKSRKNVDTGYYEGEDLSSTAGSQKA